MNWKGFEGISRRFMEALSRHPEMVENPQKRSVTIATVACDLTKYIPNASQDFCHYSRLFAATFLWQQKVTVWWTIHKLIVDIRVFHNNKQNSYILSVMGYS